MIDLALISIILVIIGLLCMPIYSSYVMEWRIKKYAKKFKLEEVTNAIIKVMESLQDAGLIEGEKDQSYNN